MWKRFHLLAVCQEGSACLDVEISWLPQRGKGRRYVWERLPLVLLRYKGVFASLWKGVRAPLPQEAGETYVFVRTPPSRGCTPGGVCVDVEKRSCLPPWGRGRSVCEGTPSSRGGTPEGCAGGKAFVAPPTEMEGSMCVGECLSPVALGQCVCVCMCVCVDVEKSSWLPPRAGNAFLP